MKKRNIKGITIDYDDGSHRRVYRGAVIESINDADSRGFSMEIMNMTALDLLKVGEYFAPAKEKNSIGS